MGIVQDDVWDGPPAALREAKNFISAHTHHGNPAEANKSDFSVFVGSLGLPPRHQKLLHLKEFLSVVVRWWVDTALQEAGGGASYRTVARLVDVAVGVGADRDNPKLIRALT